MKGVEVYLDCSELDGDEVMEAAGSALASMPILGFELVDDAHARLIIAPEPGVALDPHVLKAALESEGLTVLESRDHVYPDVDWSTQWRTHFRPLRVGRLDVVPSWSPRPDDAGCTLVLDPSMAFGTGLHPTTQLCLRRLEAAPAPETLLDVGTGSGILALSALMLGCEKAWATDNDPDAVRVARENAGRNQLADRLVLEVSADPDPWQEARTYPTVVANILAEPLIDLAPRLAPRLARGGRLLLSGLLVEQADAVSRAYGAEGLEEVARDEEGEWALVELRQP